MALERATIPMKIKETGFAGLLLIEPRCFQDERGFFLETFQASRYHEAGITDNFVQDNHSRSARGVLRGLHFTVKAPQAQIVTLMRGHVFDVTVDLRRGSEKFGRWFGVALHESGPRQIYMAAGFAHGFCVLSEFADLHYKVSSVYDPTDEGGLLWSDPDVAIDWPLDAPIVSRRDAAYPTLRELGAATLPQIS
jgi:dTDP-4-dehydrorhamnose 3,5-epimerase